jgi:hypothetical protein
MKGGLLCPGIFSNLFHLLIASRVQDENVVV